MLHRALANTVSLKVLVILLRDPITVRVAFSRDSNVSWCAPSKQSMSCSRPAKAGRNPRSTAGMYSPSAHPHSRQFSGRSKKQMCRWAHRSERARSSSPLIRQCRVHSCDGPQARKTHPKSHLYLETDQSNLT